MKQSNDINNPMLKLDFIELCQRCEVPADFIIKLMDVGIVDTPAQGDPDVPQNWQFDTGTLLRIKRVQRLQRDLEVNLPGAALALDLLDQIDDLRHQVNSLESIIDRLTRD